MAQAGQLIRMFSHAIVDKGAVFEAGDAGRLVDFLKALRVKVRQPSLQADIDAVMQRVDQLTGKRMQQVVESLMRSKPSRMVSPGGRAPRDAKAEGRQKPTTATASRARRSPAAGKKAGKPTKRSGR